MTETKTITLNNVTLRMEKPRKTAKLITIGLADTEGSYDDRLALLAIMERGHRVKVTFEEIGR